jgi:hypothetical protein
MCGIWRSDIWLTGKSVGTGWLECRDPASATGDQNPSAGVADGTGDAERGTFHSFISGKTLSVFDFLIEHQGVTDFRAARERVAALAGIPAPPAASGGSRGSRDERRPQIHREQELVEHDDQRERAPAPDRHRGTAGDAGTERQIRDHRDADHRGELGTAASSTTGTERQVRDHRDHAGHRDHHRGELGTTALSTTTATTASTPSSATRTTSATAAIGDQHRHRGELRRPGISVSRSSTVTAASPSRAWRAASSTSGRHRQRRHRDRR